MKKTFVINLLLIILLLPACEKKAQDKSNKTVTTEEINIRDQYIFADTVTQSYYMYAQMHNRIKDADENDNIKGVEVYVSTDLKIGYILNLFLF